MRKNKDSTRPEPSNKSSTSSKKSIKGAISTPNDQEAKISLPDELLSQMENEMKNWKVFHQSHDRDELVHGREPSLRSSVRDDSIDHVFYEDSVIVLSPNTNAEAKAKVITPEGKLKLFHGSPLDFREESIEYKNLEPKSGMSEGFSKRDSDVMNRSSPVSTKNSNANSPSRLSLATEKPTKINGIVKDPILVFEGKPYLVMSVQNDLQKSPPKPGSGFKSDFIIASPSEENIKIRDYEGEIMQSKPYTEHIFSIKEPAMEPQLFVQNVHDLNAFLQDQLIISNEIERPRYREITSNTKDELLEHDENEFEYLMGQRGGDLITRAARRTLEEQFMIKEAPMASQFLKKRLSVIFSTGKSMDVSTDSRDSIDETKGLHEAHDYPEEEELEKEKSSIILKEGSFYHAENEADLKIGDAKKLALYREPEMEFKESGVSKVNTSMNIEEESKFLTMIHNILADNKENKQLENDLMKLLEIYNEEVDKYQEKERLLTDKIRRYKDNNASLVEVIKNWEKEMEQLAGTNKSLHDLVLSLEGELFQARKKEVELRELSTKQKSKISKLKDRYKKDGEELEESRKQLKIKESKINTLIANSQSCESLIKTVHVNIKALVKEKTANKLPPDQLFKVLESVESKTSKFMKDLAAANPVPVQPTSPVGVIAFRDKLNVCLTEEAINPTNESLTKSYRHPSPGDINAASARGVQDLRKYDSMPVSNRSGNQKSPLKRILTNPYTSQINPKKSVSPMFKSNLTPKEKSSTTNLPGYFTKKSLTQRPTTAGEKKHHPSLSYRAGDERGRINDEEEEEPQPKKSKSRERSAPETKNRGNTKDKKRDSQ